MVNLEKSKAIIPLHMAANRSRIPLNLDLLCLTEGRITVKQFKCYLSGLNHSFWYSKATPVFWFQRKFHNEESIGTLINFKGYWTLLCGNKNSCSISGKPSPVVDNREIWGMLIHFAERTLWGSQVTSQMSQIPDDNQNS